MTTCKFVRPDGTPCRAPAQRDSGYCFLHDPAKVSERKEAQSRGGRGHSQLAQVLPRWDFSFENPDTVPAQIATAINEVRRGELAHKDFDTMIKGTYLWLQVRRELAGKPQMDRIEQLAAARRAGLDDEAELKQIERYLEEREASLVMDAQTETDESGRAYEKGDKDPDA